MTRKMRAINSSIAHWKRMIKAVKTRPIFSEHDERRKYDDQYECLQYDMEDEIRECWDGEYCALCNLDCVDDHRYECEGCPIVESGFVSCEKSSSIWTAVNRSRTWKMWLKEANRMLKMLESVRRKRSEYEAKQDKKVSKNR